MILGVNAIRLLGQRSGVGRAIEAVLGCLAVTPHPFTDIRLYTPQPLEAGLRLPPGASSVVLPSRLPPGLWEQVTLPKAHGRHDLLFCPSYVAPLACRSPVLLVHHGSYEGFPEAFPWWPRTKARLLYQASARRADLVVTVSEHSKRAIMHYYGLDEAKIRVIPEGVDTRRFRRLDDPARLRDWRRHRLGGELPCLLYVGKPNPRRNLPSLLRAFARLRATENLPHKLVLIGTDLPGDPVDALVRELALDSAVVRIGFAGHEEIVTAYNAADIMIYPSSYEGFGMPVLEAMACGTPVIALDNTAFPEFAGGVARLLPDAAPATLAAAIRDLIGDEALRRQMRREGPIRAAAYDWRVLTARYVAAMRELVG